MKLAVGLLFLSCYFGFVVFKNYKLLLAWLGVTALLFFQLIPFQVAWNAINWNVMGIFVGTLVLAELFIYSKAPAFLADSLVDRTKTLAGAILTICFIAGFLSMFLENVATVLIVAPIAFSVAKRLNVSAMPFLIGIAVSSNLQGTATLIGDPPSMILGTFAKMNFMDFIFFQGKPGIFFAVQIGAIASFLVLYLLYRKYKESILLAERTEVKTWGPTILLILLITALIAISFLPFLPDYSSGAICMLAAIIGLTLYIDQSHYIIKHFDYETFGFLIAVFILVGALVEVGVIKDLSFWLSSLVKNNVFLAFTAIVWFSVLFSAFIDNVPFVLAMLPLTQGLAVGMNISPYLFYFGLLIGACLGGNITPIGASANVVACGLLKKHGEHVSFWDFFKIGFPFTIAATLAGYLFIWLVYSPR